MGTWASGPHCLGNEHRLLRPKSQCSLPRLASQVKAWQRSPSLPLQCRQCKSPRLCVVINTHFAGVTNLMLEQPCDFSKLNCKLKCSHGLIAAAHSGLMRMCCDIFAAARMCRGRLLTTGRLSCQHPIVVCAGRGVKVDVAGAVGSMGVLRAMRCHWRAGFQQCQAFVEMGTVRCCLL